MLRFRVDLDSGRVSERTVLVDSVGVDNLELDGAGNLWMVLPLNNELLIVSTATGARHSAFRLQTAEQQEIAAEFVRRGAAGTSRMELFTPAAHAPLPGFITGVIIGAAGQPVYLTGLGNALVRMTR